MAVSKEDHLTDLILLLLKHGASVDAVRKDGATPLHITAGLSYSINAEILLENGASHCLGVKTQDGSTPLHEAAKAGTSSIVKRFLDCGAEVDVKSEDSSTPLLKAVKGGSFETVRLLVENGAQVTVKLENGVTPLHEAAKKGSFEIVQFLVRKGAEVTAVTEDGVTPLHIAAGLGNGKKFLSIVEFFLQNGADIHAVDTKGNTPLHYSVKKLSDPMRLLVQYGANINAQNINCETALTSAVGKGWVECYEYLLSLNPDVNVEGNRKAFHLALNKTAEKFEVLAKQMIQQGFKVVAEDASNPELLFGAILKRRPEIVRSLLECGASVREYRTFMVLKVAPLHFAIRTNQPEVVRLLLDHGANVNMLRGPSKQQRTPITDAAECASMEIMRMLLASGAKVHDEPSLLHLAAKNTDSEMVCFLLEEGFRLNSKNDLGETPLSIAVHWGNIAAIHTMVIFGAHVDISHLPNRWGGMYVDSAKFEQFLNYCFSHPGSTGETIIPKLFCDSVKYGSPSRSALKILARHLIKLGVVYEAFCARGLIPNNFFEEFDLREFQRQCELEIESMKLMEFCSTNLTVYDVLTKNISQIACCARNPNFYLSLKSYLSKSNCPIYGSVILTKVDLGCPRRQWLDQGIKVLGLLWQNFKALPHDLKEFVISYLSNQDLRILVKSVYLKKLDK